MIENRANLQSSPVGCRSAQNNAMHSDGNSAALHCQPVIRCVSPIKKNNVCLIKINLS